MELHVRSDGTLFYRDTSPAGILAAQGISGHWRLKRGAVCVLDCRGVIRFESEVHRCACCTLRYDTYEMSKQTVYCKGCWNAYHSWRRQVRNFQKSTGADQDCSMRTFQGKYLKGELTESPPTQVVRPTEPCTCCSPPA